MSVELGFDVLTLPEPVRMAYRLSLPAILARKQRAAVLAAGGRPNPGQMLEWMRAETGDEGLAQELASRWAMALLEQSAHEKGERGGDG